MIYFCLWIVKRIYYRYTGEFAIARAKTFDLKCKKLLTKCEQYVNIYPYNYINVNKLLTTLPIFYRLTLLKGEVHT